MSQVPCALLSHAAGCRLRTAAAAVALAWALAAGLSAPAWAQPRGEPFRGGWSDAAGASDAQERRHRRHELREQLRMERGAHADAPDDPATRQRLSPQERSALRRALREQAPIPPGWPRPGH